MMLEGIRVTGELYGLMLELSVEQWFHNPLGKNVEVVYTFPLPWGAVLLGVDVQLGDRHLVGAVVEKQQAEASYEEALSEGNAVLLLERNHDHSYCLNLGNLGAGEQCVITLRYAQTLQFEQHGLRLLIPTAIAPRYGRDVADGGLQPHQACVHDLLAEYPFDITLQLCGELAHARVASPSHPVSVAAHSRGADAILTVSLARRGALDRDFVLSIDQLIGDSSVVLARDCVEKDCVVALASFCPRIPTQAAPAIALKILVDCSGSMEGDSLEAAKRSLQAIVRQLGQSDRFSLSRFGSDVEHHSRGLWLATDVTRLSAQRWIDALQADLGGTEMEAALRSTFALSPTTPADVLIVTDGEISAIDRVISSAKVSGHRVFAVGIGSSPAESHLRRLAEATLGACDFVAPGEAVEPAVLRMFARLRSPRLTDLALVWPADLQPRWVSSLSKAAFDGDTIKVFALLQHPQEAQPVCVGKVRLLGRRSVTGDLEEVGSADFPPAVEQGDTLSRLAAFHRLQSAEADWLTGEALEAAQLAVAYQLVTEKTSFLLVHQRDEEHKARSMPDLYKIKQMVPAGWSGFGSVMFSRSKAYFETRVTKYELGGSLDWSDLDTTAGIKLAQNSPKWGRTPKHGVIDRNDSRYWSGPELTPLGLSEWLRINPVDEWPTTYLELRQIGVGIRIVEWLEQKVATRDTQPLPEQAVIEAFLYVMSLPEMYEAFTQSQGLLQSLKHPAHRFTDSLSTSLGMSVSVDIPLVEQLNAALNGMTALAWPDQIYADRFPRKESPGVENGEAAF
jgi:Ca-activated chloride channel family protein